MPKRVETLATALGAVATENPVNGDWMLVFPAGSVKARDGRGPFAAGDRQALQAIIDRSMQFLEGLEMMVDYDHQEHFGVKPGVGGTARAAGWVKQLEARDDGIWARVEWTEAARASIKANEYRYLSPLFTRDAQDRVHTIRNIALINIPALSLDAIAAQAQETDVTFLEKLKKKLGLDDNASEEAILAAIGKAGEKTGDKKPDAEAMKAESDKAVAEAMKPVALAAGLKEDADAEAVAAAVKKIAEDAAKENGEVITALQAELKETATKLTALQGGIATDKASALVDAAIKQGRVGVKPLRDHYVARAAESAEAFAAVEKELSSFPTLSGSGTTIVPPAATDGAVALSAEQKTVAAQLGISEEDMAKQIEAERKGEAA